MFLALFDCIYFWRTPVGLHYRVLCELDGFRSLERTFVLVIVTICLVYLPAASLAVESQKSKRARASRTNIIYILLYHMYIATHKTGIIAIIVGVFLQRTKSDRTERLNLHKTKDTQEYGI